MALWTAADAAAATGGKAIGDWQVDGLSIDTRSIAPGELFVALKDVRDGHDFVADALAKGAAAAMVSRVPDGVAADAPLLVVEDVLAGLERLGRAGRARSKATVIGITGSVGKTSTKEMLRAVLAGQGKVHAAEKSFNNHWGVPITLARMPVDADFAVIEIGMSNPGEIAPLAAMADLDAAMVTTVAAAHLEAFESLEGIAREKAAIFHGLRKGGLALVNGDLATTPILLDAAENAAARVLTFGEADGLDAQAKKIAIHDQTTVIEARIEGREALFKLRSPGRHFALNGLAVLALVQGLGLDLTVAICDLGAWVPPAGRGARERIVLDDVEDGMVFDLIDDAFNANPASIRAALEVLAAAKPEDGRGRVAKGRRIAVLGDMLELGQDEVTLHSELADLTSLQSLSIVHCVGPRMRHLYQRLPAAQRGRWAETAAELAQSAHQLIDAGDVIMVKGSKGSKVSLVVDALRKLGHPLVDER